MHRALTYAYDFLNLYAQRGSPLTKTEYILPSMALVILGCNATRREVQKRIGSSHLIQAS